MPQTKKSEITVGELVKELPVKFSPKTLKMNLTTFFKKEGLPDFANLIK